MPYILKMDNKYLVVIIKCLFLKSCDLKNSFWTDE